MAWSVAYRLALLATDNKCRPGPGSRLLDRTARIGLLVDLVLDGRVDLAGCNVEVDTSATGSTPHDRALSYVQAADELSVTGFIEQAPVRMVDVLDAHCGGVAWFVRLNSRRLPADHVAGEAALVRDVLGDRRECGPATAAVITLAGSIGLVSVDPPELYVPQCRAAAVLVAECIRYLSTLIEKLRRDEESWRGAAFSPGP